jgi:hypothetical protein
MGKINEASAVLTWTYLFEMLGHLRNIFFKQTRFYGPLIGVGYSQRL